MSKSFDLLKPYLDKSAALDMALSALSFDFDTTAPKKAASYTHQAMAILSKESYDALMNNQVKELLDKCLNEDLTTKEKAIVLELQKIYDKLIKIPSELYNENRKLEREAQLAWEEAKEKSDYSIFQPYLEKIIENQKAFIKYREDDQLKGYDVLLNDYEPGFTVEVLDQFFELLKKEIVPLIEKVKNKNHKIDTSFLNRDFDIEKQREFSSWLANYVGFDLSRGIIKESVHPYTTQLHKNDVRFTTHYYKNQLDSAIYSTIHESGHAKYEQGIADNLTLTLVGSGTSMGMHESQSRFYENCVGRNKNFLGPVFNKLKETFPHQLSDVTLLDFYKAVNKFEPGLIRIEADELTYSLHIMVRYEIEKRIFNGEVDTVHLPTLWNQMYQEYLGVTPKNDAEGILQDVHWSGGSFGYFPSYALGSAIAAQIYDHLQSLMPIQEMLTTGDFDKIDEYLQTNIYQFGKTKTTQQLLKDMMNQSFDSSYYIKYLKDKYHAIYEEEE